jgi:hypothetical protein
VSAWIVSQAHIDVLVLAGVQYATPYDVSADLRRGPNPTGLTAAGVDLWAQNHRSVNFRYDERTEPPAFTAPTAEVILDPVAVVKAIDCYVYQSCEHPGWTDSRAAAYCRRLRAAIMENLPVDADSNGNGLPYPAGWEHACWGIESINDAAATPCPAATGRPQ